MGSFYSYFFPKKEEFDFTEDLNFEYSIYSEPLIRENLIFNDIECVTEDLKR